MNWPEEVSDAVDFAPYIDGKIPWGETHIFAIIAGVVFACAAELGVALDWGGDWDGDGNTKEHKLQDWGHIQRFAAPPQRPSPRGIETTNPLHCTATTYRPAYGSMNATTSMAS